MPSIFLTIILRNPNFPPDCPISHKKVPMTNYMNSAGRSHPVPYWTNHTN